ncbi:MAG: hypothetical protein JWN15_2173 [Firmicutes bacterium]|nr:hypothetical protein [Bacillota bacterium]
MANAAVKFHHKGGADVAAPATKIQALIGGPARFTAGQVVLTATAYATGGIAVDLTQDIPQLTAALVSSAGGYAAEYDATNKKIKLYTAPGAEVTNATALTLTVNFLVLGTL